VAPEAVSFDRSPAHPPDMKKNVVLIHLESISWQKIHSFPEAFPNFQRLSERARRFRNFFSSATSTQMFLAYLAHANDCEMDTQPHLAKPVGNNPSLFSYLKEQGYDTKFLCVTSQHRPEKKMLPLVAGSLPDIWSTDRFAALIGALDSQTKTQPFCAYVWNLASHLEHAVGLPGIQTGFDRSVEASCRAADDLLGAVVATIEANGIAGRTTIVIFGDHGDDFWTHGFKGGLAHGTEPYAQLIHAPLLVIDPQVDAKTDQRLASTIDLAPTIVRLLGLANPFTFSQSGSDVLGDATRRFAHSQNFTALQPDNKAHGILKSFAIVDERYNLMVHSGGLEFFNHRLDPGNQFNLLGLLEHSHDGAWKFAVPAHSLSEHFRSAFHYLPGNAMEMSGHLMQMVEALKAAIGRKENYLSARAGKAVALRAALRFAPADRGSGLAFPRAAEKPEGGIGRSLRRLRSRLR
jgi:hypothetical protein